ncbi:MAG: DUF3786 domain-containing protein [Lachnospiraceae bacterium]|nr:DUF3786 domain-containing protein [Lachnospiraceae bacterium]
MEVVNNKTENPIRIYQEKFREMDPQQMAKRSGCEFRDGAFEIQLMNRRVKLTFPEMETFYEDGSKTADNVRILLARYVMEGVQAESSGKMYSYPEMPWGPVYEVQFRGRCISRMAGTYGHNLKGFQEGMEKIGAKEAREASGRFASGADCAYDIPFLPKLTIRALIWEADEEFPASAQILFSDNFPLAFTAEDMAVVGDIFLNAMKGKC